MKRMMLTSTQRLAAITAFIALVVVVVGLAVTRLHGPGLVALLLGAIMSSALAIGLMVLVFHSNRSGLDGVVNGLATENDGDGHD